jgi:hypothetical protein
MYANEKYCEVFEGKDLNPQPLDYEADRFYLLEVILSLSNPQRLSTER